MSRVVAVEHVTLDGVIQSPARPDEDRRDGFTHGGWAAAGSDPAIQTAIGARMGDSWSLLLGRVTYEDFARVWPNRPQPNPFTDVLNQVQKLVASTTLTAPLAWQNSTLLEGNAADAVARRKRESDATLVIFGSGVLVQSLLRRNLVDEFVLAIHPIVLGAGRRLFPRDGADARLRVIDSTTTATGVIVATYQTIT